MTTRDDRATILLDRPRDGRRTTDIEPVPQGWGSHEERRMVLLALAAFVVLSLYASAFVLLGHALSP